MSKIFKLREFLTLEESASYLKIALNEPVSITDLYRLALDGHLKISIDFVNHAYARKGKWVKTSDIEFYTKDFSDIFGKECKHTLPLNHELHVSDDNWISLKDKVESINGVWDLTMLGAEKLDIEHYYQQLTSGLEVTLVAIDGVFVEKDDVICQLQDRFSDKDIHACKEVHEDFIERLEQSLKNDELSKDQAKKIRDKLNKALERSTDKNRKREDYEKYYPAGGIEDKGVLVIRTTEITRFIQSLEEESTPKEKPLGSRERNTFLTLIPEYSTKYDFDPKTKGIATALQTMTQEFGSPISDDTIRKILKQIPDAIEAKSIDTKNSKKPN